MYIRFPAPDFTKELASHKRLSIFISCLTAGQWQDWGKKAHLWTPRKGPWSRRGASILGRVKAHVETAVCPGEPKPLSDGEGNTGGSAG